MAGVKPRAPKTLTVLKLDPEAHDELCHDWSRDCVHGDHHTYVPQPPAASEPHIHDTVTVYLAKPSSNICLTFGMCIGRACTLTVLYNLNMRKANGQYSSSAGGRQHNTVTGNSMPLESGFAFTHGTRTDNTAGGGISVHQQSIVHVDAKADRDDDASYDGKDRGRELV